MNAPSGLRRGPAATLALCLGLAASAAYAQDRPPAVQAQMAREAYAEGRYQEAVDGLARLVEDGHASGAVYYDLGNASYRAGHLGEAILAYRRAELFLPRDGDLAANLAHVRQDAVDRFQAPEDGALTVRDLIFWYDTLTLQEQTLLALVFNAVGWAALILWRSRRVQRLPLAAPIFLVGAALMTVTAVARHVERTHTPGAVVLEPEVTARSGTDAKSIPLFYLHEGAEVRARGPLDKDHVQVELPDGRRGWVERRFLGMVLPNAPLPAPRAS